MRQRVSVCYRAMVSGNVSVSRLSHLITLVEVVGVKTRFFTQRSDGLGISHIRIGKSCVGFGMSRFGFGMSRSRLGLSRS